MSWDGTYANGADGACQNCGEPTSEEWHAFCGPCFRREMGWDERDEPDELEEGLDRIDGVSPLREECPECGEIRVLVPVPGSRVCFDCKAAHR